MKLIRTFLGKKESMRESRLIWQGIPEGPKEVSLESLADENTPLIKKAVELIKQAEPEGANALRNIVIEAITDPADGVAVRIEEVTKFSGKFNELLEKISLDPKEKEKLRTQNISVMEFLATVVGADVISKDQLVAAIEETKNINEDIRSRSLTNADKPSQEKVEKPLTPEEIADQIEQAFSDIRAFNRERSMVLADLRNAPAGAKRQLIIGRVRELEAVFNSPVKRYWDLRNEFRRVTGKDYKTIVTAGSPQPTLAPGLPITSNGEPPMSRTMYKALKNRGGAAWNVLGRNDRLRDQGWDLPLPATEYSNARVEVNPTNIPPRIQVVPVSSYKIAPSTAYTPKFAPRARIKGSNVAKPNLESEPKKEQMTSKQNEALRKAMSSWDLTKVDIKDKSSFRFGFDSKGGAVVGRNLQNEKGEWEVVVLDKNGKTKTTITNNPPFEGIYKAPKKTKVQSPQALRNKEESKVTEPTKNPLQDFIDLLEKGNVLSDEKREEVLEYGHTLIEKGNREAFVAMGKLNLLLSLQGKDSTTEVRFAKQGIAYLERAATEYKMVDAAIALGDFYQRQNSPDMIANAIDWYTHAMGLVSSTDIKYRMSQQAAEQLRKRLPNENELLMPEIPAPENTSIPKSKVNEEFLDPMEGDNSIPRDLSFREEKPEDETAKTLEDLNELKDPAADALNKLADEQ